MQYRMEQMEINPSKVLSFEEWYQSVYQASRQGVAHGGIMGVDGRAPNVMVLEVHLKKELEILIPNEVAKTLQLKLQLRLLHRLIQLPAGLMSGIGGL